MAKGGRFLQTKAKKGGWARRIILILLALLLALVVGGIVAGATYYNAMLNLVTRPEATEKELSDEELERILGFVPEKIDPAEATEAALPEAQPKAASQSEAEDNILNIMLIGQQAREKEVAKLSDTMILVSINKDTKTITLTSFLRDLYTKLPNFQNHKCGKNRMNVAYNLGWYWAGEKGGMEMLDQLILENFGVEVDYNVEIGLETFTKVIDILGGVDVEMSKEEASVLMLGSSAGTYHLDGENALNYARTRYDNDFHRTRRQRTLVTNLLNMAKQKKLTELHNMLKEVLPLVITDMTNEEITSCALELLPMLVNLDIVSNQCPAEGTYYMKMIQIMGVDSSVIICDEEANRKLLMEIAEPPAA